MSLKDRREENTYEWEFGIEWFKDLQSKVQYNVYQSEYYELMADDYNDDTYRRKAERTLSCSKVWDLNYYVRHGLKQIKSIIAANKEFLVIVEVKTRKNDQFAAAAAFVDSYKQNRLRSTAELYLAAHPTNLQPRFDVIEVYAPNGIDTENPVINHLEDAFQ